jgi:hypothetical protein
MVAERKELERNALVQTLGRAYQGLKQGPSRGTVIFLALVASAVLIFVVVRHFINSSKEASSERWYELDMALFPAQLDSLLKKEDLKKTPQERLARFKEARHKLASGQRDLGDEQKRKEAYQQITEATGIYEELAKSSDRLPALLHQEALWGAAKGYETLGGGDNLEKAKKLYTRLKDDYKTSALGKDARKQLDRLNSDTTRQDLQDLARELAAK